MFYLGIIFICVVGTLLHFTYELSHHNKIVAIFSAVNESTWEHIKICMTATIIWSLVDGFIYGVDGNYLIPSLDTGLVIFTGVKDGYGNVVIVEQVDGVDVWYGNLTNINVKLYDYIEKGSLIGGCDNNLYLVFKSNGEILNYEDKI